MENVYKSKNIINWLFFKNEERSIFRKAFRVFIFTLPAYLANLGLLYLAPRLVNGETFGIFFLSNTIINWMFAPAIIISMYLLRDIKDTGNGQFAVPLPYKANMVIKMVAKWSAVAMFIFGAISLLAALFAGISSPYLIPLIFLIVSLAYVGESFRTYFQATDRFMLLGSFNMFWMVSRFVLGGAGLYIFQTVWGGLLGIAVALGTVFFIYYRKYIKVAKDRYNSAYECNYSPPGFTGVLPGMMSYSALILTCNIDIIVAYFVLDSRMLGIYSASSVLTKAMLVLAFPLTHSVYPALLTSNQEGKSNDWIIFIKGLGVTSLIAAAVIASLYLFSGVVCSQKYGIVGCDMDVYHTLLIPPFFLFILIFLSLQSFSIGNDWLPMLLCIPTVIFVGISIAVVNDVRIMSISFAIFSILTSAFYFLLVLRDRKNRHIDIAVNNPAD